MADEEVTEDVTEDVRTELEVLESIEWLIYQYVKHTVGYEEKPVDDSSDSDVTDDSIDSDV